MNACTFLVIVVLVIHVLASYNRIILTFMLKIMTLELRNSCSELQMFFSCMDVLMATLIRAFTSASNSSCLFMTLSRYVKVSTNSRASLPSLIWLFRNILSFRIFLFSCKCLGVFLLKPLLHRLFPPKFILFVIQALSHP